MVDIQRKIRVTEPYTLKDLRNVIKQIPEKYGKLYKETAKIIEGKKYITIGLADLDSYKHVVFFHCVGNHQFAEEEKYNNLSVESTDWLVETYLVAYNNEEDLIDNHLKDLVEEIEKLLPGFEPKVEEREKYDPHETLRGVIDIFENSSSTRDGLYKAQYYIFDRHPELEYKDEKEE